MRTSPKRKLSVAREAGNRRAVAERLHDRFASPQIVGSMMLAAVLAAFLLWGGCAPTKPTIGEHERPTPIESDEVGQIVEQRDDWVEETLRRLSLEEKVAQMVSPRAFGFYMSSESDEWQRLERLVRERRVGGFTVFQGDVYATAIALNRLQQLSELPLLIGADYERGAAMRTRRTTPFPEMMALAATRNPGLAYQMGKVVAKEGRALGIHQNYAPVVDVNNNPINPVINTRSFGEDPHLVAEMAAAYAGGLQEEGMIATAKHFPGHGDAGVDSHLKLPMLQLSRERLDSIELIPFRALIDRGVMSVMIAHVAVPSIDPLPQTPATVSQRIVTGLLRDELGFQGLIVADAFEMLGLLTNIAVAEASVRAVEAGVDVIIVPPVESERDVIDALVESVRSGRISESRIDASVRRILNIKRWLKLDERRTVDLDEIAGAVSTPDHWRIARTIARDAITVLKNDNVIPLQRLGSKRRILNVVFSDIEDYRTEIHRGSSQWANEGVGNYFAAQLRKRNSLTETVRLDPRANRIDFDTVLVRAQGADVVICPIFVKARSGMGTLGLPQHLIDFANLLSAQGKPTIFIAMGSPYVLGELKNGNAYICAYSDGELPTEAAVEVLFGEIQARGRLPVSIPTVFPIGSGLDVAQSILREDHPSAAGFEPRALAELDTIVMNAIRDKVFPGARLLVAKDGVIVYNKSFGKLTYSSDGPSVSTQTMYDIASLTKVVGTTAAVMKLYEGGQLDLDAPAARYIPELAAHGKGAITIRNLLLHNGGLLPFAPLYLKVSSREQALESIYGSRLVSGPGDSTIYSDFGMVVLGQIVEKVSGVSLDKYLSQDFYEPLGMSRTMFNPPASIRQTIAPTEVDTVWRKGLVHGTVHDGNAALLGGVAGHAGLFSTASDLAIFMHMMMNGGTYAGRQYLKPETIKLFTTRYSPKSTRALGWDTRSVGGYSSAGSLFSERSFGHTGFTGTSLWADPERNIFVILLTNCIHPLQDNRKIVHVRPLIHDAVVRALNGSELRGLPVRNKSAVQ